MRRLRSAKGIGGFTLVELLIVLVIVSILLIGLGRLFTRQLKTFSSQDETAKMQEQARMAEDLMLKTIQQTGGYTSDDSSTGARLIGSPILAATDHLVAVQYDDPLYTTHVGVIRAEEIVIFAVSKDSANVTETVTFDAWFDQNNDGTIDAVGEKYTISIPLDLTSPPYNLYRMTPDPNNPTAVTRDLIAQNVDNFYLRYFDNNGKQIPVTDPDTDLSPLQPPYNLNNAYGGGENVRPNIRSMEVELTLRSSRPDPEYKPDFTINANTVGSYVSGAPGGAITYGQGTYADDHYRRRSYKSMITPRNLPTSPCGRITLETAPAICPADASVTAMVTDRYGLPIASKPVKFSLPSGVLYPAQGPSLSGGAGTGASTSVSTNAAGNASASVAYTFHAGNIVVSAEAVVDCTEGGGPANFTLSDAITVPFLAGQPAWVTLANPFPEADEDDPFATCEAPTESLFLAHSYDQCGNSVEPDPGYRLGVYDATPAGGSFYGTMNSGTNPVELTASGQSYTVQAPVAVSPLATNRTTPAGLMRQYLLEENRPAWVLKVVKGELDPPYGAGGGTIIPANTLIHPFYTRPWPPASIDEVPGTDNIDGSVLVNLMNDCPGTPPRTGEFYVKDCKGITIWDVTESNVTATLSNAGASPAIKFPEQVGTITGITAAGSGTSIKYNTVVPNQEYYQIEYDSPECQFSAPGFAINADNHPVGPYAKPALEVSINGASPLAFTPWVRGCESCLVTVDQGVTTCDGVATVTITLCGDKYVGTDAILTINGGVNASWVTKTGATWTSQNSITTTVTLQDGPSTSAVATAYLGIGDTPKDGQIHITAESAARQHNLPANPVWQCSTQTPLVVANECQELKAYYDTATSTGIGPKVEITGGSQTLCAAGMHELFVELKHCLSTTTQLMPDTVEFQIVDTTLGVLDSEYVTLTATANTLPATVFNNFTDGLPVSALAGGASPVPNNGRLEYPDEGTLRLVVKKWVSAVDNDDVCPDTDIEASFVQPLPICFPNAITSGGGASWNGNFKVHWGDVVVRGLMTAPSKKILKSDPGAVGYPVTPTNGPPQFNESPFSGNNYTDRFVDIYVGHQYNSNTNPGTCDDGDSGCMEGAPVPAISPTTGLAMLPGEIYQPFKAANYGNYFTNISYDKITAMIVTLNYDTMKQLAKNRNSFWITVSDDNIWHPAHGVMDISDVLMDAPNSYYNGEYIFIDTYTTGFSNGAYQERYPSNGDAAINADALAGNLPTHEIQGSGGFFTQGIIYIAGNMEFGGLGGTGRAIQSVPAPTPPQLDTRYDHNTATFTEDDLPIRPDPAQWQGDFNLSIHINGALYVDGAYGGSGNPSIFGAITGEQGYSGSGTPEVWYNYTLNQSGMRNSLCVQCCSIEASPATVQLEMGGASQTLRIYNSAGTLQYSPTNSTVASITLTSQPPATPYWEFTLTPGNAPGTVEMWFADVNNCNVVVPVTVTTNCSAYYLNPSGTFPNGTDRFDVGMSQPLEITNGTSVYGAGNWTWSSSTLNVINPINDTDAAAIMTANQCGNTTVTATDSTGICNGNYTVNVSVTSPLTITADAGPYNIGNQKKIYLDHYSAAGNLVCTPTTPLTTCVSTGPGEFTVTINDSPKSIVSVTDTGYGAACTPLTYEFTIDCQDLAPGITLDSPSSVSSDNYYGTFGNRGALIGTPTSSGPTLLWKTTAFDNDGLLTAWDKIDYVKFEVTPSDSTITGVQTAETGGGPDEFCGFGGATCAPRDISYWTDRYGASTYKLTATGYTIANDCGEIFTTNPPAETYIYVRNCMADDFQTASTPPPAANWEALTCGSTAANGCNTYSAVTSGGTLAINVSTGASAGNPTYNTRLFEKMHSTNFPLAFDTTKFEATVTVKAIDRSGPTTGKAGLRIEDSSGTVKDFTIMGYAGNVGGATVEAPIITSGGAAVALPAGQVYPQLKGDVTYKAVYTYSGGAPSLTYTVTGTLAGGSVSTTTLGPFTTANGLPTFAGALKVGPYFNASNMGKNKTGSATFDNYNLCKRNSLVAP